MRNRIEKAITVAKGKRDRERREPEDHTGRDSPLPLFPLLIVIITAFCLFVVTTSGEDWRKRRGRKNKVKIKKKGKQVSGDTLAYHSLTHTHTHIQL